MTNNNDDFNVNVTDDMFDDLNEQQLPDDTESNDTLIKISEKIESKNNDKDGYLSDNIDKKKLAEHRSRDRIKGIKNRRIFRIVWLAMVILVGVSLASYLVIGSNDLFGVNRVSTKVDIDIPKDIEPEEFAQLLKDNALINSTDFFYLYFTVTSGMDEIRTGKHLEIATDMDYENLISTLGKAEPQEEVTITFIEGLTIREMAKLLDENGVAEYDEILEIARSDEYDNYDMIANIDNADEKYYKLEGYLFPDQYNFYTNEDLDSVLGKMLGNFQKKITADMMVEIEESGYTLDEIITLASIVQAEAADDSDMYKVSAVLHNRLERGAEMDIFSLGMDSTYFYPYNTAKDAPNGYISDYQTDTKPGLPAGAVCNPGAEAINAVLNPDKEYKNMFYFCHDKDGNTYYAENYSKHQSNLEKAGLT